MAEVASRYPTSQPEEGDTLGQLDSLHSEPTVQENEVILSCQSSPLQPGTRRSLQGFISFDSIL